MTDNNHDTHILRLIEDGAFDTRLPSTPNYAFAALICLCTGFWLLAAAVVINW
jgi:hypothetical protein